MRSRGSKPDDSKRDDADAASKGLGNVVRARRRALGLSQLELCDLAAVGPAFLYELEHGKPTVRLDKVLAVLQVLGLELQLREGKRGLSATPGLDGSEP